MASGSGPSYQIQKPTSADASNGIYTFRVTGNIRRVVFEDPEFSITQYYGRIVLTAWYLPAGAATWLEGGVMEISPPAGSVTETVAYDVSIPVAIGAAIGQHGTNYEIGVSIRSVSYSGHDTLSGVTYVIYTTNSGTESTATPSNLPAMAVKVVANNG